MNTIHYRAEYADLPDPGTVSENSFWYVHRDTPRAWWCKTIWVAVGHPFAFWTQYGGADMYELMRLSREHQARGCPTVLLPRELAGMALCGGDRR